MKRTSKSHHTTLNELNITPLLDLAFVLLVIFIITTPQLVNNLEMILPSGKHPPSNPDKPPPKINRIVVDDAGQAFLNDRPLAIPALKEGLKQLKLADPELRVVVRGSDRVDYQHIIDVLDSLQQLEITKVGLATTE